MLLNKKEQAQVFKARLNRMSGEATNMDTKLHVEELKNASDQHIISITLQNGRTVTIYNSLCGELLQENFHQGGWSMFDPVEQLSS